MKRWQKVVAGAALLVLTGVASVAVWLVRTTEPRLRRELEVWLSERLNSDVALASLTVRLYPTVRVEGTELVLRIKDRPDLPPFIVVERWTGTGSLTGLRAGRLDEMRLDRVAINVPPGRKSDLRPMRMGGRSDGESTGERRTRDPLVDRLVAEQVVITVLPRHADRDPVVWDVRDFVTGPFSLDAESPFTATVDTPLPDDRAEVSGTVGPFPRGDFDRLPITASFTFAGDLGAIPGMTGELTASGNVLGTLERLATSGIASSNQVGVTRGATGRLPMTSTFEAVFDGTSGDLFLSKLTTTIGASAFQTAGSITRRRGVRGRHVHLTVATPDPVDVGDLMRLLVDGGRPPVLGRLTLDSTLEIEPGEADVLDRLQAAGRFQVRQLRFANPDVQAKVDTLSRRGQGRPTDTTISGVAAGMDGRVTVRRNALALNAIRFTVPGVRIDAAGNYGLASQRLDFRGVALLDAGMSRTLTGAKRVLLRPFDPLQRKDGAGTRLVLAIGGTRNEPDVNVDVRASLRGRK